MDTPRTCVYTYGPKTCKYPCHKSKSGVYTNKCSFHMNRAASKAAKTLLKKRIGSGLSSEEIKNKRKTDSAVAKLKMSAYRETKLKVIEAIENINVRRIATSISKVCRTHKYVLVENVIPNSLKICHIELKEEPEPITFSSIPPYKRTMQTLTNPEAVISDVLEAIKVVYNECSTIKVKMLKSNGSDKAQTTHYDLVQGLTSVNKVAAFHYSALISLQADTKLLIGEERVEVDIPPFSMLFFRGDMCHAGAGYKRSNSRLFISASSLPFPATEDVHLVK